MPNKKGSSSIEHRLHRVVGQIKAVEKMVAAENDQQALIQLQACISALEKVKVVLIQKATRSKIMAALDEMGDKMV